MVNHKFKVGDRVKDLRHNSYHTVMDLDVEGGYLLTCTLNDSGVIRWEESEVRSYGINGNKRFINALANNMYIHRTENNLISLDLQSLIFKFLTSKNSDLTEVMIAEARKYCQNQ